MNVGCAVDVEPCAVIGKREQGAGVRASILAVVYAIGYPFRMFGVSLLRRVWVATPRGLTLRSTSLPSVAGRCAIKPRSAG